LLKNGKTKIPDRVLVDENKVIVIDYKFGDKESQSHKTQIKEYVACLQQMDYSNIEAYIWYVSIEKIVMVG
jgi:ATP-dependent exoDNAse (exonuclease V) beta subunit